MPPQIICGSFPVIREAFAAHIQSLAPGPERPVAVVAPSRALVQDLQRLLAGERGLTLLNVSFHTFFSLAQEILEEHRGVLPSEIRDDLFHDRLIDTLLRQSQMAGPARPPRGLASAFRASLRDLLEAGVDPDSFETHFLSDLAPDGDLQDLPRLFSLLKQYKAALQEKNIMPLAGLPLWATRLVEEGRAETLGRYHEIVYYGFYDLNGQQSDFFRAVATRHPTSVFFPYEKGRPAYKYIDRFYELKLLAGGAAPRHLPSEDATRALGRSLENLFGAGSAAAPTDNRRDALKIFSVSGVHDEIWCAAKEILKLVEDPKNKMSFDDIGVVARTLEPYRFWVQEIFTENGIPFSLEGGAPLLRQPLAKTALHLMTLKEQDFPVAAVLPLLSSPFFTSSALEGSAQSRDKLAADWRELAARLGIHSGFKQWKGKLERYTRKDYVAAPGSSRESGQAIPRASTETLWSALSEIESELSGAVRLAGWRAMADFCRDMLLAHFRLSAGDVQRPVMEAVLATLDEFRIYEALPEPPTWEFFLETWREKLERTSLGAGAPQRGVRVLDAMDARGQNFRALFMIGLKEGLFPRQIREDPLLRDAARLFLQQPGGYWIGPKNAGYDEERLLFYLAAASASEKLFCLYPRSNDSGNVEVPSLYLRDLCLAAGVDFESAVTHLPRAPLQKWRAAPENLLTPKEMSVAFTQAKQDAAPLWRGLGVDAAGLSSALAHVGHLNQWNAPPGPRDGLVGKLEPYLRRVGERLSPSSLDTLNQCPFRYFFKQVLGLDDGETEADRGAIAANIKGETYHLIFEAFYAELRDKGFWTGGGDWHPAFEKAVHGVFSVRDWAFLGIYPLLWQSLKEDMTRRAEEAISRDIDDLRATGFVPHFFEETYTSPVPFDAPGWPAPPVWLGRPDRVDIHEAQNLFRIIDYKTRWKSGKKLSQLVETGYRHQPPLYLEIIKNAAASPVKLKDPAGVVFRIVEPNQDEKAGATEYPGAAWAAQKKMLEEKMAQSLAQISAGQFFIVPDEGRGGYCNWCAFANACRKSHPPSRHRAEESDGRHQFDARHAPPKKSKKEAPL